MNEDDKFEILVQTMVEEANHGNEEVNSFENAIEASGNGWAGFRTWDDSDNIDFIPNYTSYAKPEESIRFYAEYYDGCQAPFRICEWKADISYLEVLLKTCSKDLYAKYEAMCHEREQELL